MQKIKFDGYEKVIKLIDQGTTYNEIKKHSDSAEFLSCNKQEKMVIIKVMIEDERYKKFIIKGIEFLNYNKRIIEMNDYIDKQLLKNEHPNSDKQKFLDLLKRYPNGVEMLHILKDCFIMDDTLHIIPEGAKVSRLELYDFVEYLYKNFQ